jgi:uncharacterized protein (TIGR01777 family)
VPGSSADLAVRWEQAAEEAREAGVRVVRLRIGIVLGEGGGALEKMLLPFRFFVGGPFGSGQQWFPWIHLDDVVGLTAHALQDERVDGAVNAVSPGIVRLGEFCRVLGRVMKRPVLAAGAGICPALWWQASWAKRCSGASAWCRGWLYKRVMLSAIRSWKRRCVLC